MTLQFRRFHPVDPRRPLVAFYRRQSRRAVLVRYHCFHQVLVHRSLSEGSRNGVSSPSPSARHGCTASASGIRGVAAVVAAPRVSGLFGPFQSPLQLRSLALQPFAPAKLPPFFAVGSEEARLRARLRPPLKLYVRFSRIQLSRRLMLPRCNRRNSLNQVHQPVLAVQLGFR